VRGTHWAGLIEWVRERLLASGRVDARDLELLHALDDPKEISALVDQGHRRQRASRAARRP
jgi:predicted Rossmann-fold nucleotide-binding protein